MSTRKAARPKSKLVSRVKRAAKAVSHKAGITTLYVYARKINGRFARTTGAKRYNTYSEYIDHLIEQDRKNYQRTHKAA